MDQLKEMLELSRKTTMSAEERELQRQSFAYGNTKFENERITRATVDRASKALARDTANKQE